MKQDNLFSKPMPKGSFIFDKQVAEVFDDMAVRSIPGYKSQQFYIAEYASKILLKKAINIENANPIGSCILDLGCSTGETIKTITEFANIQGIQLNTSSVYGVDSSEDMVTICTDKLSAYKKNWMQLDIFCLNLEKSGNFFTQIARANSAGVDMVILNFVLQFINPDCRDDLLANIWNVMNIGGVLILGEKTMHTNKEVQNIFERLQYFYKSSYGYSYDQIEGKKQALDGVLMPDTISQLEKRFLKLKKNKTTLYFSHGEFRCYSIVKTK